MPDHLLLFGRPRAQHLQSNKRLCDRPPVYARRDDPSQGKALFGRPSIFRLPLSCPVPSHPRKTIDPLQAHLSCQPAPTCSCSRAYFVATCAVQNAHPCQQPASHFRASERTPSQEQKISSACPLSLPPCPCATEAEGFPQGRRKSKIVGQDKPQANPESPLHSGPSLAGTLSRESCLRRLSWAICFLGAHLRRQPRCITTTRPKRRPFPPTGLLLGSGCLYTPSLQTAHHHPAAPWRIFSPPPLIFAGRQVDSISQSSTCVIYARSLYHTIIQKLQYRPSVVIPGQPRGRFHLLTLAVKSNRVRLVNSSLTLYTALP